MSGNYTPCGRRTPCLEIPTRRGAARRIAFAVSGSCLKRSGLPAKTLEMQLHEQNCLHTLGSGSPRMSNLDHCALAKGKPRKAGIFKVDLFDRGCRSTYAAHALSRRDCRRVRYTYFSKLGGDLKRCTYMLIFGRNLNPGSIFHPWTASTEHIAHLKKINHAQHDLDEGVTQMPNDADDGVDGLHDVGPWRKKPVEFCPQSEISRSWRVRIHQSIVTIRIVPSSSILVFQTASAALTPILTPSIPPTDSGQHRNSLLAKVIVVAFKVHRRWTRSHQPWRQETHQRTLEGREPLSPGAEADAEISILWE
ncbi:hypothetical protein K438DRAFT_2038498 [Mycena galopus ATCC 62051]|nr:hypothetical protein K438DRAFT_2038498 [Mycena galopus ATCC 62051]